MFAFLQLYGGVPVMARWLMNPTSIHEDSDPIPGLAHSTMGCGVGHRGGWDPVLLWLWRRPAVAAPVLPLAWEPPHASGAALKRQK